MIQMVALPFRATIFLLYLTNQAFGNEKDIINISHIISIHPDDIVQAGIR
jgi:hypothetical protein